MNIYNCEKFQMSSSGGCIYVSKKTHKIFAIALHGEDFRIVQDGDKEAHILIKGLLLNGQLYYSSEFFRLMDYVDKYEDPFIFDALLAFRECCHNAKFDAATKIYID